MKITKSAKIAISKTMPEARLNIRITTSSSADNLFDEKMYTMEKIISYRANSSKILVCAQNVLILSKMSNKCREFSLILTRVLDQISLLRRSDLSEPIWQHFKKGAHTQGITTCGPARSVPIVPPISIYMQPLARITNKRLQIKGSSDCTTKTAVWHIV